MALAVPGQPDAGRPGLRLIWAERQAFDAPARVLHDPAARAHLAHYLTDLAQPYGIPVPAEPFESPDRLGQSYGEMAEVLIRRLPADEPVDLLVLAFAVPDMWPGRATATYLSHVCPGTPLSFAICEQGSAAPFTALRVARDYTSAGRRRALLLVLEQAVLPYPADNARLPDRHQAVALLFDAEASTGPRQAGGPSGPVLAAIRQRTGVPAAEVADRAVAELAGLATELGSEPRLLVSESLAAVWPSASAEVAPAGQPITGLWWQLADELVDDRPLVIADYEPELGYLCLAAIASD